MAATSLPLRARGALRRAARGAVEVAGTASGLAALLRRLHRGRVAILAYHNVVEPGEVGRGDASLHLPLPDFLAQIEWVASSHRVTTLDEALSAGGDGPRAVITFDDAYRGAVTLAFPELRARGLPATVFVSPGLLGASGTWWDRMAEAGRLTPEARAFALEELGGRGEAVRRWAFPDGPAPDLPPSYGIATRGELETHRGDGIEVGSHAWEHEHLPSLSEEELRVNLERTRAWIEGFGRSAPPWLALPYGCGSAATRRLALEVGHAGVLRIEGGPWTAPHDRGRVPRINLPAGVTVRGLQLRVTGLLGKGTPLDEEDA